MNAVERDMQRLATGSLKVLDEMIASDKDWTKAEIQGFRDRLAASVARIMEAS